MSHMGVEVAPQTPTLEIPLNHSISSSELSETRYDRGLISLHTLYRIIPFELFLPLTNTTAS